MFFCARFRRRIVSRTSSMVQICSEEQSASISLKYCRWIQECRNVMVRTSYASTGTPSIIAPQRQRSSCFELILKTLFPTQLGHWCTGLRLALVCGRNSIFLQESWSFRGRLRSGVTMQRSLTSWAEDPTACVLLQALCRME